ncbi:MAG: FtsW/RodA/SpoVE family cell cycle protein [Helicobacter sp.]|nr:FtsW/RodA/SpoVE family cell cycle protein [Helicobacter sp.]
MPDAKLFIYTSILITIGVIMSYSLGVYPVLLYRFEDGHFFLRQFAVALVGILIMWGFSYIDMGKYFTRFSIIFFILCVFGLVLSAILPDRFAPSINGARRWIKLPFLPFNIAPIEFLKVGFVLFLALSFPRKFGNKPWAFFAELALFVPYALIFGFVFIFVAFFQNDLGQMVLLGIILISLLLLSGGSFRIILSIILGAIALGVMAISARGYRLGRIKIWWSNAQDLFLSFLPDKFADLVRISDVTQSYQLHNAINAMQNGSFTGQGVGEGILKLGFLSDVHTDMVLAGITEETGILGLILCFFLFFMVIYRIFRIAARLESRSHFLFCMGVALLLACSLFINALGIASIIPLKGMAVPFLTYGGSSLLANCMAIGIVLALSKRAKIY